MCDIVIADDEYLEREVIRRIIDGVDGARVVWEGRAGKAFVESCIAMTPQIVFFSCSADGDGSLEDLWRIRKNDKSVVIFLTAVDEHCFQRKDVRALRVNESLLKPIRPSGIDEIVRKYIPLVKQSKPEDTEAPKANVQSRAPKTLSGKISKEVSAALLYIDAHYKENISLKDVADEVYLSSFYLSRLFKKEVGVNFSTYLLNTRLDDAKRLLETTATSVSSISSSLSFSDLSYFCRVFKNYTSFTPKEYRNRHLKENLK